MTISVIVPSYNRAGTVGRALESIFKQTMQDIEVIVVDDGSTDDTASVIEAEWADRVHYHHQENQGACVARNTGISLSKGEYVAFLDSDDEWEPEKLEKQLAVFNSSDDPNLGVVLTGRRTLFGTHERSDLDRPAVTEDMFETLLGLRPFPGRNIGFLVHRKVFEQGVRFDPDQPAMQDWDFLVQAARHFEIRTVLEPLLIAHRDDGGTHIHSGQRVVDARVRALEKYADDLRVRPSALANHHRGLAGSYRVIGDTSNMRKHLRAAVKLDPTVTGRAWTLASKLGARGFNTAWQGSGVVNRGLTRLGLPKIRGPFD